MLNFPAHDTMTESVFVVSQWLYCEQIHGSATWFVDIGAYHVYPATQRLLCSSFLVMTYFT